MTVDQLIFVGFRGYAMALHRDTGEIVWCNSEMRSGYVSMLLDGDRLIVSCSGPSPANTIVRPIRWNGCWPKSARN